MFYSVFNEHKKEMGLLLCPENEVFGQSGGVSVETVLNEKNARYVWSDNPPYFPNDSIDFLYNKEIVKHYFKLAEKYMPFTKSVASILKEEEEKLLPKNSRILGILARGTDYTMLRPYFHPVQPSIEMIISEANKYRKEYDCDKIYVATEDQNNLERLKKEYGEDLIYIE